MREHKRLVVDAELLVPEQQTPSHQTYFRRVVSHHPNPPRQEQGRKVIAHFAPQKCTQPRVATTRTASTKYMDPYLLQNIANCYRHMCSFFRTKQMARIASVDGHTCTGNCVLFSDRIRYGNVFICSVSGSLSHPYVFICSVSGYISLYANTHHVTRLSQETFTSAPLSSATL
jgi:hypothetical protein